MQPGSQCTIYVQGRTNCIPKRNRHIYIHTYVYTLAQICRHIYIHTYVHTLAQICTPHRTISCIASRSAMRKYFYTMHVIVMYRAQVIVHYTCVYICINQVYVFMSHTYGTNHSPYYACCCIHTITQSHVHKPFKICNVFLTEVAGPKEGVCRGVVHYG